MKISEIKSEEVRNEAVRLAISDCCGFCHDKDNALSEDVIYAFVWRLTPQKSLFWADLHDGTTPNTTDLKLPNL